MYVVTVEGPKVVVRVTAEELERIGRPVLEVEVVRESRIIFMQPPESLTGEPEEWEVELERIAEEERTAETQFWVEQANKVGWQV